LISVLLIPKPRAIEGAIANSLFLPHIQQNLLQLEKRYEAVTFSVLKWPINLSRYPPLSAVIKTIISSSK
jgi:hypothetical protein